MRITCWPLTANRADFSETTILTFAVGTNPVYLCNWIVNWVFGSESLFRETIKVPIARATNVNNSSETDHLSITGITRWLDIILGSPIVLSLDA